MALDDQEQSVRTRSTGPAIVIAVSLVTFTLAACGSSASSSSASSRSGDAAVGQCPGAAVKTVVSVDQWGDIVRSLGGACADVTTVIQSSAADPHDYEPTAGDLAAFSKAELVVVNGVDYDPWATRAASNAGANPAVLNAGTVTGVSQGANPHLWYSPQYVTEVSAAVTNELKKLAPQSAAYFDERATAWTLSMKPYFATIAGIKSSYSGKPYAATETVFDYMAAACGLANVTPQGYQNASANRSDPAPGDVAAFDDALTAKKISVLIYNTQTTGSVPEQIRRTAESARVSVVDVTESVPPGVTSFEQWQVTQLHELQKALAR